MHARSICASVFALITAISPYTSLAADELAWRVSSTGTTASLRALAIAKHSISGLPVAWAAGSKGTVVVSVDAGMSWQKVGPAAYPELEFRGLHAWDERQAIMASAGTPAIVLKTNDAGSSWREVHRDENPKAFFDGLKFFNDQRGVLFGDPIDGRFTVLTTQDRGDSWQAVTPSALPAVLDGEAAFAASNSAMIVSAPASIWIGTGGVTAPNSCILSSHDFGKSWTVLKCPLVSDASSGIFSLVHVSDNQPMVVVGGNYKPEDTSPTTCALSNDQGKTFVMAKQPPRAFRSSVVWTIGTEKVKKGFYAAGPSGTDYSSDGSNWIAFSDVGFHTLAVLPSGELLSVGSEGRVGRLGH